MRKAVIYTRVSTEEQSREGVSLDNQLEKCRLQAQLNEYEIYKEIADPGQSAKDLKREGIQQVIRLVKEKLVDSVIIFKLDRLTRNVSDLNRLIELFLKKEVELISVRDSINTATASGRMILNLLATVSQWERESISERTRDALQYKKSTNQKYTRITPYGFKLVGRRLIEDPEEQGTIFLIRELRDKHSLSYQKIADKLNSQQILTRLGGEWIKQTVQKIYSDSKKKIVNLEQVA